MLNAKCSLDLLNALESSHDAVRSSLRRSPCPRKRSVWHFVLLANVKCNIVTNRRVIETFVGDGLRALNN